MFRLLTHKKNSQSGFSLVELMVVVAIIGVLAAIAVPNVNKYLAKARQAEAKTNLSSLYTSEKAFFAEYSAYDTRFGAIGFSPEGRIRYNIGFTASVAAPAASGFNTPLTAAQVMFSTQTYCGAGTMTNNCMRLNGATGAVPPGITAAICTAPGNGSAVPAGCTATNAGTPSFQAGAVAVIQTNGLEDRWAIDSDKFIRNTQSGIR